VNINKLSDFIKFTFLRKKLISGSLASLLCASYLCYNVFDVQKH